CADGESFSRRLRIRMSAGRSRSFREPPEDASNDLPLVRGEIDRRELAVLRDEDISFTVSLQPADGQSGRAALRENDLAQELFEFVLSFIYSDDVAGAQHGGHVIAVGEDAHSLLRMRT